MLKFPELDQTKGITWIQLDPFDMKGSSKINFISTTTPNTCLVEHEVNYLGHNINDGFQALMPDWQHCKTFCAEKFPSAQYFAFVTASRGLYASTCWCKSSNAEQRAEYGVTSGEVTCSAQGEPQFMQINAVNALCTWLSCRLKKNKSITLFQIPLRT